ncbi:MAG: DUF4301 family protein [Bacteroidales bacterium]|nr:DUF4301 family protein [Bacteroidales bacterium]
MLTTKDKRQIRDYGAEPEITERQLKRFKEGFPFTELVGPASIDSGIAAYNEDEKGELAVYFDKRKEEHDICRFVPASGAATRMFKSLYEKREELVGRTRQDQINHIASNPLINDFFNSLNKYPFYRELGLEGNEPPDKILDMILGNKGLNYGALPKGLISFHDYGDISRTAFEEHLHEAARLIGEGDRVKLHFTVSEEHFDDFRSLEKAVVPALENAYQVQFDITYSFQKRKTDTIAVDLKNRPFRDEDGKIVFRPGGHGALLENLNDLNSDIIFINNIDNISPDRNSDNRILNKKMLGGILLKARSDVNELMQEIAKPEGNHFFDKAIDWLKNKAYVDIPNDYNSWPDDHKRQWVTQKLDRPLRVCGMVKNEGEPGGGPFFTKNREGEVSLQIVEPSQVDQYNEHQLNLFRRSSHFNPVDLVCSIKRQNGRSYNLSDYVDHDTGFISIKSVKGKDLKALELPGLWNGSMAGWITIFAEISSDTFTPVKTIFDLIRPAHNKP